MSRKSKKKSTSKYRKFKISPLIPVIAIIEVLVLIAISSYAWFIVVREKQANTGLITVDADSGLNIDFKNANYEDEINLWDYVPEDFEFSPVTSLDGRNVFVPTSGTFGNDTTNSIVYRDATINDINTKYVDVDFTLTNTNDSEVYVYLNNESHFRVYDRATATNNEEMKNSRALRLAFYTNDAKHGNVGSSILENTNNENATLARLSQSVTVYFNKPSHWNSCNAYIWKRVNSTNYEAVSWPGSEMTHVAGTVYSYTFSNVEGYTSIVFNNGQKDNTVTYDSSHTTTYTQTRDLKIYTPSSSSDPAHLYEGSAAENSTGSAYSTKTVYFRKPNDWTGVRAHAFRTPNETNSPSFTSYPGDECTNCGADIYSYTFPATYNGNTMGGIVFNNLANQNNKTADLAADDGALYYFTNGGSNGACTKTTCSESTVYFNNIFNWSKPYVKLKSTISGHVTRVPMTNLSAGVYYATVPSAYYQIAFEDRDGLNNTTTDQTTLYKYTQFATTNDGYIYRPDTWTNTGYSFTSFSYTDYVGDAADSYAVISPGVSAGFQRAYTPVVGVHNTTGAPIEVVPAFASSIDNYIMRSGREMFRIPANGMLDLSMVVWLEGTDKDCTNANYAAKNIELYLEFSTSIPAQQRESDSQPYYTYRFFDKTRECWTSDRLTNEAGVSVAPVMQLYDNTDKRGYLMHAASTTNHGNTRKVDVWECSAPATLYTAGHDLYFRRVDPYNEDEVWNYWHPVSPQDCNGAALEQYTVSGKTNYYVNFTAFADGAPASTGESGIEGNSTPIGAATNGATPARSCGGLWGKKETRLLTIIDGTSGHWYNNNNAVMTLNYTYSYGNSKTQAIEYKTSGPYYGQIYYAVVPIDMYDSASKASGFSFKRFYDFDTDYAMNIKNRNASMTYSANDTFTISGALKGYYAEISQSPNSTKQQWFGKDILFCNISYTDSGTDKNLFNGTNIKFKLLYKNSSNQNISLNSYAANGYNEYNYLYDNNGSFQHGTNKYNGYISVVPWNATKIQAARSNTGSTNWTTAYNWLNSDCTYNSANHNLVLTHWSGTEPNNIAYAYNNSIGSSWPQIPATWYPE